MGEAGDREEVRAGVPGVIANGLIGEAMAELEMIADLRGERLKAIMGRLLMLLQKHGSNSTLADIFDRANIEDPKERTLLRGVGLASNDIRDDGLPLEKVKYVKVFWVPEDPASMEYEIDII
jgi:hypothetical protein